MEADKPRGVHQELVTRLLESNGHAPRQWRRAAFDNAGPDNDRVRALVEKVATTPTQVSDDDFARVGDAGLSEDQAWEIVICAAVGQSARQYESALDALAAAVSRGSQP
jgi:alkylhydroperoxidase family enzyme